MLSAGSDGLGSSSTAPLQTATRLVADVQRHAKSI